VNYEQFVSNLEKAGIEYTLFRSSSVTWIEVGRFGYAFGEQCQFKGGWIRDCADDWRAEWQEWMALLRESI
jgi:hypothetical protein